MRNWLFLLWAMFGFGLSMNATANEKPVVYPIPADVASIDGIIRAFYEVVSTPAGGTPDQQRDASLHAPGAQIRLSRPKPDGTPHMLVLTLDELHARFGGIQKKALFEREVHRVTQRFGSLAQVWSTYVTSATPNGPTIDRGISSIHLYFDGKRWWITGWFDEGERPGSPIPSEFILRQTP
jgi:hypothetical protein